MGFTLRAHVACLTCKRIPLSLLPLTFVCLWRGKNGTVDFLDFLDIFLHGNEPVERLLDLLI